MKITQDFDEEAVTVEALAAFLIAVLDTGAPLGTRITMARARGGRVVSVGAEVEAVQFSGAPDAHATLVAAVAEAGAEPEA